MSWDDVEKQAGGESSTEKIPYTRFEKGATIIRILDNEPHSFWSHWLQQQKTSITCPGKGCPICNVIAQMRANKQQPPYTSTQRHALRVWNYKTNQMEVLIQGKKFFSDLLALHREVGDITTYDIKVIRNGEGTDTTYMILPQTPAEFTVTEGIEDVDLAELLHAPTNEEIIKLMEGKSWDEINSEAEEQSA